MRHFTILFFLLIFSLAVPAQKTRPKKPLNVAGTAAAAAAVKTTHGSEKEQFDRAAAQSAAPAKIEALQKFIADFPFSSEKNQALEMIAVERARIADEKLRAGETAAAGELFKLAVRDAPAPIGDRLFTDIILPIPNVLFGQSQRAAAAEAALLIENKVENNARQLLGLATFYLGTENAGEAKRLAEKSIALDPKLPAAYQTLGVANRLNFNLEEAASAYSKALELDPDSVGSKRSLAEMRRALGEAVVAIALYREILAKDPTDNSARNNMILALFDAGKKVEAEEETANALKQNPNNIYLMVGVAYWYAAHNESQRAVELAQKSIALEPRYIWAYLALSRGLLLQTNRYQEAERALLAARNYGSFPTLDYELATVRNAAGFYREAAQELAKNFTIKDGAISTKLGGRVEKQANSFIELLALERRASIFEPTAADSPENSQKLKSLLDFYRKLESPATTDAEIGEAADRFVEGADKMKLHRRIFVADRLLAKNKALPKVAEMMRAAIAEVDAGLSVPNPAAAILADQLYESRVIAVSRNEIVIVPDVPRQTLSNIARGRIEELTGWALFQENKPAEAIVRLKRAVGILPEKSSWWRSSVWRLGAALQSDDKPKEALDAYVKGYANVESEAARRIIIEGLYRQINGSLDGLDQIIGAKLASTFAASVPIQTDAPPEIQASNAAQVPKIEETPAPVGGAPPEVIEKTKKIEITATAAAGAKAEPGTETKKVPSRAFEKDSAGIGKSLFDPIIITVPKIETPAKPFKAAENRISTTENRANTAESRPRIAKCSIAVSQPSISLVNNGGNLGILVGFENGTEANNNVGEITASASNSKDIAVDLEPAIGAESNRAFFIVKSISANTGLYTITFEAPCGKKEVLVRVR